MATPSRELRRFVGNALALTAIVTYGCFVIGLIWMTFADSETVVTVTFEGWLWVSLGISAAITTCAATIPSWRKEWTQPWLDLLAID
ncbi:MAG: hypothetical protein HY455_01265 [Parcubacteria group bacterium]|nr:hypothetical protein [Parcubacteria group bacterium]